VQTKGREAIFQQQNTKQKGRVCGSSGRTLACHAPGAVSGTAKKRKLFIN
jgi:hypothetical protein